MKRYARLFLLFFKNALVTFMNHRFNFIMSILANIVWTISQVVTLYYLSKNINQFENWNMHELIVMLGIGQFFVYTMFILYYRSIIELGQNIITGELDRLLTKPVNLKFLLSLRDMSINEIVPFVTTVLPLVVYGLSGIDNFTYLNLFLAFLVMILAIVIMYLFMLVLSSLNFFVDDARVIVEVLYGGFADFNRVPMDLLPKFLKGFLTYIFPVAFVSYFPVTIIKGTDNFLEVILTELVILVIMFILSVYTWKLGLKRYSGVG